MGLEGRKRRAVGAIVLAMAVSWTVAMPGTAIGLTENAPEAVSQPPDCGGTHFCYYENEGFTGRARSIGGDGCVPLSWSARSYINNDSAQGYFRSNRDCTGSTRAVTAHTSGNIGFPANSFQYACVTCRTEG
jgi:hypothetical protein